MLFRLNVEPLELRANPSDIGSAAPAAPPAQTAPPAPVTPPPATPATGPLIIGYGPNGQPIYWTEDSFDLVPIDPNVYPGGVMPKAPDPYTPPIIIPNPIGTPDPNPIYVC